MYRAEIDNTTRKTKTTNHKRKWWREKKKKGKEIVFPAFLTIKHRLIPIFFTSISYIAIAPGTIIIIIKSSSHKLTHKLLLLTQNWSLSNRQLFDFSILYCLLCFLSSFPTLVSQHQPSDFQSEIFGALCVSLSFSKMAYYYDGCWF